MPDMTGIELLTKVHALDPAAKRALLTGWGDLKVGDRLVRAAVLGQVDDWGLKPWQPGDEGFTSWSSACCTSGRSCTVPVSRPSRWSVSSGRPAPMSSGTCWPAARS